ncbi:hypothetical protein EDB81DRAFT_795657, partial [Dactylonectria macrodidyma]
MSLSQRAYPDSLTPLAKETYDPNEVQCNIDARAVTRFDAPSLDDTTRTDAKVLQSLVDWMEKTFGGGTLLTGIIYPHMQDNRRPNDACFTPKPDVILKFGGEENLSNVMLITSWWEVCDSKIAVTSEAELRILLGHPVLPRTDQPEVAEGIVRMLLQTTHVTLKTQSSSPWSKILQQRSAPSPSCM